MGLFDPLLERVTRDLQTMRDGLDLRPTLRLGTVTGVGPVRVHLDGDTQPLPATPRTLVPVGPGDRVTVAHHKRVVTILGVLGTTGRPWRMAAGQVEITGTGDTTAGAVAQFPAGRFTVTPRISPTPHSSVYLAYRAGGTSPTQIEVGVRRFDGAPFNDTVTVSWTAVQMTPTSSGG